MSNNQQPPTIMSTKQTLDEERNIAVAKEYMSIAYSPTKNKGAQSVEHLCHPDARFWSPSTFPGCKTPMGYAASHSKVMASVSDLQIERYDQAWAKDTHVLLRYTASGSHCGEPYQGIEKSGPPRKARWWAAAIFEIEDRKVRSFTKDWDQKVMQIQLGWAPVEESQDPRWDEAMLRDPEMARGAKG